MSLGTLKRFWRFVSGFQRFMSGRCGNHQKPKKAGMPEKNNFPLNLPENFRVWSLGCRLWIISQHFEVIHRCILKGVERWAARAFFGAKLFFSSTYSICTEIRTQNDRLEKNDGIMTDCTARTWQSPVCCSSQTSLPIWHIICGTIPRNPKRTAHVHISCMNSWPSGGPSFARIANLKSPSPPQLLKGGQAASFKRVCQEKNHRLWQ